MNSSTYSGSVRERCPGCEKHILCHQKCMICRGCNALYHGKCSEEKFMYDHVKVKFGSAMNGMLMTVTDTTLLNLAVMTSMTQQM
jgi:hypothetical protein